MEYNERHRASLGTCPVGRGRARRPPGPPPSLDKPIQDCLQFLFLGSCFFSYSGAINPQKRVLGKALASGGEQPQLHGAQILTPLHLCMKKTELFFRR